ncbi:nitrate ABC transporter substrate-binding protein [Alsobacter sp. SYSU M60028]|uniref:Nitrate ABC transporter substrate-binding protein n=1 Tax=Alsobacter ponti TaxID=2962936 RepID=A0ABT1L6T0_9HYPH|nr:nitrate ABC transporter substrate-binding protein [Alsobacter ponti]MCP8937122.1 nitrate ABC transporter substrate-binding protein [Alsobacter ponti]
MKIRLAVRDWDFLTPLLLGDVRAEGFDLELDRVAALPDDLPNDPRYDGSEMSLSRYSLGKARGESAIVGYPHFLMRAFRHRCIITRRNGELTTIADLRGKTIGLAGWQDSGNTWTRAILRREGIGIEDAQWRISRLLPSHPIVDRLGGYGRPGLVETIADDTPLLPLLEAGRLDAVFMPFMPPGFFGEASPFRQLLPDFRQQEVAYFNDVGYVPGIHLLGLKASFVEANPGAAEAAAAALDKSWAVWAEKRLRYADTTPWLLDELRQVAHDLPEDWAQNGYRANLRMLGDFCTELTAQGLTGARLTPQELFPQFAQEAQQ